MCVYYVCACMRKCVRVCVRACVCVLVCVCMSVCIGGKGGGVRPLPKMLFFSSKNAFGIAR